jgi:glutamyl aminopeptidase
MGHPTCLEKAGQEFKKWLQNTDIRPNPDLKNVIYYYGMQSVGTEEDWEKVFNIFVTEQGK